MIISNTSISNNYGTHIRKLKTQIEKLEVPRTELTEQKSSAQLQNSNEQEAIK